MLGTIVWIVIVGAFQVSGSKEEQVGCEAKDIFEEYSESCKRTYVEDIFKNTLRDGKITATELLNQLSSTCRNHKQYMLCAKCTARHVCPEEKTKFLELLSERWSLFCDCDQPSEWLTTILQNGYSYNEKCSEAFHKAFMPCISISREQTNETSLTDVSDKYKSVIADYVKCSVGGILSFSEVVRECGSSWQDILLTHWLSLSAEYHIWIKIGEDDVKLLQAMRC